MSAGIKQTIEQIKESRTLTIACSARLERYFKMLHRECWLIFDDQKYRMLNVCINTPIFNGVEIHAAADFYFVDRNSMTPILQAMGQRVVVIDEPQNKEDQLLRLATYSTSPGASPKFKLVPSELYTMDGRCFSSQASSNFGYVVKSLESADGIDQVMIRPADKGFFVGDKADEVLNQIYYHISNSLNLTHGDNPKKTGVGEFVNAMQSYGYDVHLKSDSTPPSKGAAVRNWLKRSVIQPLLRIQKEYRAFVKDGEVVMLQTRPREEGDGYNQLKKCPDIVVDLSTIAPDSIEADFIKELPKFVPNMCSADVFVTASGEWGVFEFGLGYSPLAAGFKWISSYYGKFVEERLNEFLA